MNHQVLVEYQPLYFISGGNKNTFFNRIIFNAHFYWAIAICYSLPYVTENTSILYSRHHELNGKFAFSMEKEAGFDVVSNI